MFPFAPSIATSVYLLWHSQPARFTNATIFSGFFAEVSTLILFAVLYSRQGRKLSALGLGFQWTDLPKGLGLFFISFTAFWVASSAVARLGHTIPFSWSAGMLSATSLWYVVPFLFLNPFFEEIVVRGYLMTEIIELRSSTVMAALISLAFQTSYHVHYGIPGALCLALGLAFFRRLLREVAEAHAGNPRTLALGLDDSARGLASLEGPSNPIPTRPPLVHRLSCPS
jgi:membrane protease YdiL (CAAX protease family)